MLAVASRRPAIFLRQPGYQPPCDKLVLGFASQPHDWFAFVENDDATGSKSVINNSLRRIEVCEKVADESFTISSASDLRCVVCCTLVEHLKPMSAPPDVKRPEHIFFTCSFSSGKQCNCRHHSFSQPALHEEQKLFARLIGNLGLRGLQTSTAPTEHTNAFLARPT